MRTAPRPRARAGRWLARARACPRSRSPPLPHLNTALLAALRSSRCRAPPALAHAQRRSWRDWTKQSTRLNPSSRSRHARRPRACSCSARARRAPPPCRRVRLQRDGHGHADVGRSGVPDSGLCECQEGLSHQGHVFTMLHNMAALQAFCKHIGSVRKQASDPRAAPRPARTTPVPRVRCRPCGCFRSRSCREVTVGMHCDGSRCRRALPGPPTLAALRDSSRWPKCRSPSSPSSLLLPAVLPALCERPEQRARRRALNRRISTGRTPHHGPPLAPRGQRRRTLRTKPRLLVSCLLHASLVSSVPAPLCTAACSSATCSSCAVAAVRSCSRCPTMLAALRNHASAQRAGARHS